MSLVGTRPPTLDGYMDETKLDNVRVIVLFYS